MYGADVQRCRPVKGVFSKKKNMNTNRTLDFNSESDSDTTSDDQKIPIKNEFKRLSLKPERKSDNDHTHTIDINEVLPKFTFPLQAEVAEYKLFQEDRETLLKYLQPTIAKQKVVEIVALTVELSSEVLMHIKEHADTENNEFMFELTNGETGLPNAIPFLNPIEGKKSEHDPKYFVCTKMTCHTHPTRRQFNPPSSSDIHSFILSIRKTKCTISEKQRIILSHCVISRNEIFVFTFNPVYLFVEKRVLDLALIETFEYVDFLSGSGPQNNTYIDWKQYQGLAKSVGIDVERYEFPNNTNKLPIKIRVLTTKPLDMVVDID